MGENPQADDSIAAGLNRAGLDEHVEEVRVNAKRRVLVELIAAQVQVRICHNWSFALSASRGYHKRYVLELLKLAFPGALTKNEALTVVAVNYRWGGFSHPPEARKSLSSTNWSQTF